MNSNSLTKHSIDAINSVIEDFQKNPFSFLYESDIQCSLFSALRDRICRQVDIPGTGGDKYSLRLVYSEYLDKIDIACINPEAINKLDMSSLTQSGNGVYDTYIYNLPIFLGVELKYVWMGYRKGFQILENDFLKMTVNSAHRKNIENWVVLGFIQRKEEANPFLKDAESRCSLILLDSIKHLNDIYIVTPNQIFSAKLA